MPPCGCRWQLLSSLQEDPCKKLRSPLSSGLAALSGRQECNTHMHMLTSELSSCCRKISSAQAPFVHSRQEIQILAEPSCTGLLHASCLARTKLHRFPTPFGPEDLLKGTCRQCNQACRIGRQDVWACTLILSLQVLHVYMQV